MTTKTIDLTPNDTGYAGMALMFAQQVVADVRSARTIPASRLLGSVVRIITYLGAKGDLDNINKVLEWLEGSEHIPLTTGSNSALSKGVV